VNLTRLSLGIQQFNMLSTAQVVTLIKDGNTDLIISG
jgi:hypothetical protein